MVATAAYRDIIAISHSFAIALQRRLSAVTAMYPNGHQLSGGAQGPDPVQALLQDGPPFAGQAPVMLCGTMLEIIAG
jgi:hypothetical protein